MLLFCLTLSVSWSAGTPRLRHVRIDHVWWSLSNSLSSQARLLEICNTGPGDYTAASLEPGINMFSTSAHLLDHLHLSFALVHLHDVLIVPFRGWNLLCCVAVFWHCTSGHCISAGPSTFMYCCCETSVICCTFWPVLLMYCTCGNFNGLCTWWISFFCTLNLGSLDLLGHLIHFSGRTDSLSAQSS